MEQQSASVQITKLLGAEFKRALGVRRRYSGWETVFRHMPEHNLSVECREADGNHPALVSIQIGAGAGWTNGRREMLEEAVAESLKSASGKYAYPDIPSSGPIKVTCEISADELVEKLTLNSARFGDEFAKWVDALEHVGQRTMY